MNRIFKKLYLFGLAGLFGLSLTSCNQEKLEPVNIAIGVYQDDGCNYKCMTKFLDSLKDDLNFSYTTILTNSVNDSINRSLYEDAIDNGAQGLISMVSLGSNNFTKLIKTCEDKKVYLAGYLLDFSSISKLQINSDKVVGSVTDGEDGNYRGEMLFNQVVASDNRKIAFARFPSYAYPSDKDAINKFKELASEYNKTHDDKFSYYSENEGVYEFQFSTLKLPEAQAVNFKKEGIEAIVSVSSTAERLVDVVESNVSIYSAGFPHDVVDKFGEDKQIKTMAQTPAETILYPLVQILNAVRGKKYEDSPEKLEDMICVGKYIYVTSNDEYQNAKQNCMNYSDDHDISKALINSKKAKELLAGQKGASFDKLKSTIQSWNHDYVLYRK